MKTKSKALLLALCALVLVTTSVICTIAFLTDRESVVNTFTVGNVDITVDEEKVNPDGTPTEEDDDRVKENDYHMIPGQTYVKDPTMTVKEGSEESYVRMLVTINEREALDALFAPDGANMQSIFNGYDAAVWHYVGETKDEANDTITYEFRYYTTVDASEEEKVLEPLFTSFTVPAHFDGDDLASIEDLEITVVGHAIQKIGFADADEAWAAFDEQMNAD